MDKLTATIEALYNNETEINAEEFAHLFATFIDLLDRGKVRAAEPRGDGWQVNPWIKKGILLGFRKSVLTSYAQEGGFRFFDKKLYPLKSLHQEDKVRVVPGGTSIRAGSYLAPGVVIMPPAYVNVGAFVAADTMIDSHALVGSCAQVGSRVHISAASQIGGVLEPVGAAPVIIEDDVFIGGNCGVYEGTRICRGAVLGAGTILTRSIPVYDLVHERVLHGSETGQLVIPENAIVVPGNRPVSGRPWAATQGLLMQCALIVKYRDATTDRATALESSLH
jgi:2,3,4,5-tetrahydropyridine-2-carboxylate N-succinyltransferase